MASICSMMQSPRAAKAFSIACAARTWPAPEDAESRRTRGLRIMRDRSRGLLCAGRQFFQNDAAEFLQFAEAREVILKFLIQKLGVLHVELVGKNEDVEVER